MTFTRSFASDYKFGIEREEQAFELLKRLDASIEKTKSKNCKYDFEGQSCRIELKSRRNKSNAYPTTLIPVSKSQIPTDKELYFCFSFTDGIYYTEYTPEKFSEVEVAPFCRRQRSDYNDKEQLYYHIPVSMLTKLE